ncbi:MAG: MerR family DNA-binding transcriptional regulator [Halothiobacillaceae bacterium]
MLGVSVKTLQRWEREGRLIPRTDSNRRLYTETQLREFIGLHIPVQTHHSFRSKPCRRFHSKPTTHSGPNPAIRSNPKSATHSIKNPPRGRVSLKARRVR